MACTGLGGDNDRAGACCNNIRAGARGNGAVPPACSRLHAHGSCVEDSAAWSIERGAQLLLFSVACTARDPRRRLEASGALQGASGELESRTFHIKTNVALSPASEWKDLCPLPDGCRVSEVMEDLDVPQQGNVVDCGVYTMCFLREMVMHVVDAGDGCALPLSQGLRLRGACYGSGGRHEPNAYRRMRLRTSCAADLLHGRLASMPV